MSDRLLAGLAIGAMALGLGVGGLTRYVWYRVGRRAHRGSMLGALVLLVASVVFGFMSARGFGFAAGGTAAASLSWAGVNYARFRHTMNTMRRSTIDA